MTTPANPELEGLPAPYTGALPMLFGGPGQPQSYDQQQAPMDNQKLMDWLMWGPDGPYKSHGGFFTNLLRYLPAILSLAAPGIAPALGSVLGVSNNLARTLVSGAAGGIGGAQNGGGLEGALMGAGTGALGSVVGQGVGKTLENVLGGSGVAGGSGLAALLGGSGADTLGGAAGGAVGGLGPTVSELVVNGALPSTLGALGSGIGGAVATGIPSAKPGGQSQPTTNGATEVSPVEVVANPTGGIGDLLTSVVLPKPPPTVTDYIGDTPAQDIHPTEATISSTDLTNPTDNFGDFLGNTGGVLYGMLKPPPKPANQGGAGTGGGVAGTGTGGGVSGGQTQTGGTRPVISGGGSANGGQTGGARTGGAPSVLNASGAGAPGFAAPAPAPRRPSGSRPCG